MSEIEKLRIILPHWIEHNNSHGEEFEKWAKIITDTNEPEIASYIAKAQACMNEANQALRKALSMAGGPSEEKKHGHNHT